VNEVAIMCDKLGIDVWEVIEAASTKPFGFMPFYPGPGLGGHCIPIDPLYLSWKLKSLNYNARFIELASEIWTSMPIYTVELITDALNSIKKPVNGSKIGVIGVAYKSNVNDLRESPAIDIIHMLRSKGAAVSYHDPYVPSADFEGFKLDSVELTDKWLHDQDAVVIVTHHDLFDWQYIMDQAALIIDTRNATAGLSGKADVFRIGDGRRAEDFLRK
jgi:UDP-N-acetyl-D-glucosamine dehydrogenase